MLAFRLSQSSYKGTSRETKPRTWHWHCFGVKNAPPKVPADIAFAMPDLEGGRFWVSELMPVKNGNHT
jgi:hypothetical protein